MAAFNYVTLRDTLHTAIAAQLPNTNVYKYPPGDQELTTNTTDRVYELVWLSEFDGNRTIETFGPSGLREDTVDLSGTIWVDAPGKTDTEASKAETRAQTILNAIETGITTDDTLSAGALVAWLSGFESTNGVSERGRTCQLEFTVTMESHNA